MTTQEGAKILIVHPFIVMADIIKFFVESEFSALATTCFSVVGAEEKIQTEKFDIIILASSLTKEESLPFVLKFLEGPTPPALLVAEHKKVKLHPSYGDLPLKSFIKEDNLLEDLDEVLREMLYIDTSKPPEEWTKVSLAPLVHFEELPEDVFIRLITGRMLKLFRQGDKLNQDDIDRYTNKGVKNLYLQREAFLWLVKQLDKIIPMLVEEQLIKVESSEITKEEDPIPDFKCDIPIPINENFVKEVHEKSKKVLDEMRKNKDLAKLLKLLDIDRDPKSYFRNRISLVCSISCALAKELSWSSDAMFEKFIYVAHMHDLPLIEHPRLTRLQHHWQVEVLSGITDEDKKRFLNHPVDAADLVSRDPKAPTEAEMMIRQHHERANGKGFPEALQSARIMPTAALIQIAIDFAQYILENPKWTFEAYAEKSGPMFRGGPFTKIFRALEQVCKGKI